MTAYETGYDLLAEACRERRAAQFERAAWPPSQPGTDEHSLGYVWRDQAYRVDGKPVFCSPAADWSRANQETA